MKPCTNVGSHKIVLTAESYGTYSLTEVRHDGRSICVQTDYDFPSIARSFGWNMRGRKCVHSGTDGTIDCPECGKSVTDFITEARNYLDAHDGKIIFDPGYFE
jgi:hypothetical protein